MNTMYDGIINKPNIDELIIEHYGVKGMKWRHRKGKSSQKVEEKGRKKTKKELEEEARKRKMEYVNSHLRDDVRKGKARVKNYTEYERSGVTYTKYEPSQRTHLRDVRDTVPEVARDWKFAYDPRARYKEEMSDKKEVEKEYKKIRKAREKKYKNNQGTYGRIARSGY